MNTELTERYLRAAIAGLPAATQDDVRTELTALIMDATEARIDQGEEPPRPSAPCSPSSAIPAILAAEYADRPLHLIGPRYFLVWRRLLKLLLWIVPAVAAVGVAISQALVDAPLGTLIGESLGVGLSSAVHVAFWVTVVFVVLERSGARPAPAGAPTSFPSCRAPAPAGRTRSPRSCSPDCSPPRCSGTSSGAWCGSTGRPCRS